MNKLGRNRPIAYPLRNAHPLVMDVVAKQRIHRPKLPPLVVASYQERKGAEWIPLYVAFSVFKNWFADDEAGIARIKAIVGPPLNAYGEELTEANRRWPTETRFYADIGLAKLAIWLVDNLTVTRTGKRPKTILRRDLTQWVYVSDDEARKALERSNR